MKKNALKWIMGPIHLDWMNLLLIISEEGCAGLMAVRELLRKGILVLVPCCRTIYNIILIAPKQNDFFLSLIFIKILFTAD